MCTRIVCAADGLTMEHNLIHFFFRECMENMYVCAPKRDLFAALPSIAV